MTLRRKMLVQSGGMIVGLLLISAASMWGIHAVTQDFGVALRGYEQLRRVYDIGSHVTLAQTVLSGERPDALRAVRELQAALLKLDLPGDARQSEQDRAIDGTLRPPLSSVVKVLLASEQGHTSAEDYGEVSSSLDRIRGQVAKLAGEIRRTIEAKQQAASSKRHTTELIMLVLSAGIVLLGVAMGIYQYRSVMSPLNRLQAGVKTVAAGQFGERVAEDGSEEFVALARDFNRMAGELQGLYQELEQKVAAKSRELVRSERLASVGYLAAGVAHEINNPLGIITGYAELSLKQLEASADRAASEPLIASLRVICEEAFRCKDITQKLLSMATPGTDARRPVSLATLAETVVSMLSGLRQYQDRRMMLSHDDPGACMVVASEGEMRQVLLNLTLNALEAVPAEGAVRVEVRRRDGSVELAVSDNGRGMRPETLERVFEPFFSEKKGARQPGTGLGLSITHAIVESHGGRIRAESDGVGQGSRFVVELPVTGG